MSDLRPGRPTIDVDVASRVLGVPPAGPFDPGNLPWRLEEQAKQFAKDAVTAWKRERQRASELEDALSDLQTAYLETIRTLAFMVEAKDATTGQHLERCRVHGIALMEALRIADEYPDAPYGFLLHDAGKIGVPESVLNKPGPLTAAEWRVMRMHPVIGHQMVDRIPFLVNAAEIVRSHHEMWDGSGYPEGLKGEAIPRPARVLHRRRRLRRHDHRPPLPRRPARRAGRRRARRHGRTSVRPRSRRRLRPPGRQAEELGLRPRRGKARQGRGLRPGRG